MTIDLPQPSPEYNVSRERVRNSRIRLEMERKMDVEQFGHYLRLDTDWPFGGGDVGFAIDGGNAASTYTEFIDGGNA